MKPAECDNPIWSNALTPSEASLVVKAVANSSDETRSEVARNLRKILEKHEENQ